jgi:homospermidine synthase
MKTIDNIVIVGFGSIAQALIPLLVKRYECKITIFEKDIDSEKEKIASEFEAIIVNRTITQHNLETLISPNLSKTTFLLNLAVSVSSEALIELAQRFEALYLDTCIEPWEYLSEDDSGLTSNFHLRESLKKFSTAQKINGSTSIVAHGANPGFISVLLKKALVTMAHLNKIEFFPVNHQDWAILAQKLGIRVVQISERDTQISSAERSSAHFMCTWSVDGLITECLQPAEMGWGSHENKLPDGSKLTRYAIAMTEQGREVSVRSWTPNYLDFEGYLLTHNESLSIAEYLTVGDSSNPDYRPTVYYAYHPCDQAVASMGLLNDGSERNIRSKEVLKDSISSGIDELGIFLISDMYKSLWMGSNLSIGKARKMVKYNSATSLQVVSSIIAGMAWAESNPNAGVIETEMLDWEFIYEIAEKYWQPIICQEVDWRPIRSNNSLEFETFRVRS